MTQARRGRLLAARLTLLVIASLLMVVIVEGSLSLFLRRSLRARPFVDLATLMGSGAGLESAQAYDQGTYFQTHADPRVGVVLRQGKGHEIGGASFSVNRIGVRDRAGVASPTDAFSVVILGDSVAFGAGVLDDETLAHQLEVMWNETRPAESRALICHTVAVPGWNFHNAIHFLIDHYESYHPDLVIYMPIENDLTDSYRARSGGQRSFGLDACSGEPLLTVNDEPRYLFQYQFAQRVWDDAVSDVASAAEVGVLAITSDLSKESSARYDANADAILHLARTQKARGSRLALLFYSEYASSTGYTWILRDRLAARGSDIAEIPGFVRPNAAVTLDPDPHPSRVGNHALAVWVGRWLAEQEWAPPVATLPELSLEIEALRAAVRTTEETRARVVKRIHDQETRTQATIDVDRGRGINQIYGGLNPDGTVGSSFLAFVDVAGGTVSVVASALPSPPAQDPLRVQVLIADRAVGELVIPARADTIRASFSIPEDSWKSARVEVRLRPLDWILHTIQTHDAVASFRLHSITTVPP